MYADRWPFAGMSLPEFERRVNGFVGSVKGWREFAAWNQSQTSAPMREVEADSLIKI